MDSDSLVVENFDKSLPKKNKLLAGIKNHQILPLFLAMVGYIVLIAILDANRGKIDIYRLERSQIWSQILDFPRPSFILK